MHDRPKAQPNASTAEDGTYAGKWVDIVAILILIPVLLPLVVVFTPSLYFESDPRAVGISLGETISLGPAGSAWLAVASVAIAAAALALAVWAGARVRWASFGLVIAGIVPCLIHMSDHFTSTLHGGAWIAAAALGLAAAHLAQFPRAKRIIVSAMIAMALPLFIQGAWYVYVEHPDTVQSFLDNEQQSIEARGLTFGSPEHAKYLTRLKGNDVIGAVGMSNVLGSIAAAITIMGVCLTTLCWWRGFSWARVVAVAVVTCLASLLTVYTHSKGAWLAFIAAMGLALCVPLLIRFKIPMRRPLPALCVLIVLAGGLAVLFRGAAGPHDGPDGERSLLFRFHYWQGAAHILMGDPSSVVFGVGPGTFKDRYEAVRNPISPEVVSSTHNVFVDYAVMLGLGGLAWAVLLLTWLWQTGVVVEDNHALLSRRDRGPPSIKPIKRFGLLAAVVFGTQYYVQFPGLYAETALLWLAGTLGFVAIAVWIVYPALNSAAGEWTNYALALAAALLLLHAQIEMTFFWTSAAAFVWVVAGTASAKRVDRPSRVAGKRLLVRSIPAVCMLLLATTLAFTFAEPMTRHQAHLASAARLLRIGGPPAALDELDRAAAVIDNDPTTTRWRVRLRQEIASALTENGRPDAAHQFLDDAWAVLDQTEQAGLTGLSEARRRGAAAQSAYYITGDRQWLARAETAFSRAAELSPNGLSDHVRLADIRWQLGAFASAQTTYHRALQISDQFYLDPDVQLPDDERTRITARLAGDQE